MATFANGFEFCPHCEKEFELKGAHKMRPIECPNCGMYIYPCSLCDGKCYSNCNFNFLNEGKGDFNFTEEFKTILRYALNNVSLSWDNIKFFLSVKEFEEIENARVQEEYFKSIYDDNGRYIKTIKSFFKRRLKKVEKLKEAVKILRKKLEEEESE